MFHLSSSFFVITDNFAHSKNDTATLILLKHVLYKLER